MISACAWFLGDKWDELGDGGILMTCLVYAGIAIAIGVWLRKSGFPVAGGLLVTVAVSLTPLITYTVEDMLGMWPANKPGSYKDFYPLIHGSWIVMELATIAAAALALRFIRFGFLVAPMAFSFWFFSMDLAAFLQHENELSWDGRRWIALRLRRSTFLVFGALGSWTYIGHLAYDVFKDSVLFPFVIAAIGLGMILTTVWAQRRWVRRDVSGVAEAV